jgi:calcineurin-like phosphoesterase family protein
VTDPARLTLDGLTVRPGVGVWFTSDTHFWHTRILELSSRPFTDDYHHTAELITRHNRYVSSDDDVVFDLGDVTRNTIPNPDTIQAMNGRRVLIAGNHDLCWSGRPGWERHVDAYLDAGYERVITRGHARWTLTDGTEVLLTHLPPVGDHPDRAPRYVDQRPPDPGVPVICGHLHEAWKTHNVGPLRQLNVGVDQWDYYPVPERWVTGWIRNGCPHLPGRDDTHPR